MTTETAYGLIRLRAWKGAPLPIMLYLWSLKGEAQEAVDRPTLERKTSYSDKTTKQALVRLKYEYGIAEGDEKKLESMWQIASEIPPMPDNLKALLKQIDLPSYHGAPLAILVCLLFLGKAASQEFIERTTGYTDKPVSQALALLQEEGRLTHSSSGWQLVTGERQLPFGTNGLPASRKLSEAPTGLPGESETFRNTEGLPPARVGNFPKDAPAGQAILDLTASDLRSNGENLGDRRRISDSPSENFRLALGEFPTPDSSSSSVNLINLIKLTTTTKSDESENFRAPEIFEQCLAECRRWGIALKKARELAELAHVTPLLIRAHCTTREKGKTIDLPLAIYRIREGWGIPAGWLDPDAPPADDETDETGEPDRPGSSSPDLDDLIDRIQDPRVMQAWQMVAGQLRLEMSQTNYDTWAASLVPVDIDPAGVFTLATANAYGRDWVASRLSKTLEQLLTGVCAQTFGVDRVTPCVIVAPVLETLKQAWEACTFNS